MKLTLICVGRIKEKYFTDAIKEYAKRLSRFANPNIIEIADEKIPDKASDAQKEQIKLTEAEKILAKIPKNSFVVSMCIEGKEFSSEELSAKLADISMHCSHAVFIIGGSLGLSDSVKQASHCRMSFGKITLPHQLMRVVLLEQVYRAFKILNNENYHK